MLCSGLVKRKVLVLDLDETLIHSHHDGVARQMVKPGTPPDFVIKVTIDRHPVRFFVHKRPHVDFFLSVVSIFRAGCTLVIFLIINLNLKKFSKEKLGFWTQFTLFWCSDRYCIPRGSAAHPGALFSFIQPKYKQIFNGVPCPEILRMTNIELNSKFKNNSH